MLTMDGTPEAATDAFLLFVVGAHLSGEPLNHQLTGQGGRLAALGRAAPIYRMFALPGTPARPGMVRVTGSTGCPIEGEIWALAPAAFGRFVQSIPAPLTIGKVELETGESVCGFLCEPYAIIDCPEITEFGSWRRFRQAALTSAIS